MRLILLFCSVSGLTARAEGCLTSGSPRSAIIPVSFWVKAQSRVLLESAGRSLVEVLNRQMQPWSFAYREWPSEEKSVEISLSAVNGRWQLSLALKSDQRLGVQNVEGCNEDVRGAKCQRGLVDALEKVFERSSADVKRDLKIHLPLTKTICALEQDKSGGKFGLAGLEKHRHHRLAGAKFEIRVRVAAGIARIKACGRGAWPDPPRSGLPVSLLRVKNPGSDAEQELPRPIKDWQGLFGNVEGIYLKGDECEN